MAYVDSALRQQQPKPRPTTNRQVSGYNPRAYVPGGSTPKVAKAIQRKGGQRPAAYKPPRPAATAAQRPQPKPPVQQTAQPEAYAYDYDMDPVLQRIQAMGQRDRAGAEAEALEARKKAAIDYGDEDLARSLGGDLTAAAAKNNPIGVRQQLQKQYDENVQGFETNLDSNLFHSGFRQTELGRLSTGYQDAQAGAARDQQDLLGRITQGLADALMGIDYRDAQAEGEAAQRAIDAGLGGAPEADPFAHGDIADLLAPEPGMDALTAGEQTVSNNAIAELLRIASLLKPGQAGGGFGSSFAT